MGSSLTRRRVLVLTTTALSPSLVGCRGIQLGYGGRSFPRLRVEADDVPSGGEFDLGVTVVNQSTVTDPARLRVHFTNRADEEREFQFGAAPPFTTPFGKHLQRGSQVHLVPTTASEYRYVQAMSPVRDPHPTAVIPARATDGCWGAKAHISMDPIARSLPLGSGETISETYAFLAYPDQTPCLPPGPYRFESRGRYSGQRWGFTVILESPTPGSPLSRVS